VTVESELPRLCRVLLLEASWRNWDAVVGSDWRAKRKDGGLDLPHKGWGFSGATVYSPQGMGFTGALVCPGSCKLDLLQCAVDVVLVDGSSCVAGAANLGYCCGL